MSSAESLRLIVCFGIILFLLRPITGLFVDAFKVMLKMCLAGLVLNVIPLDFIDDWSRGGAEWAQVSAQYVPVICLMVLITLSTANLIFLSGTTAEGVIRIIFYIVGGVFSVGSPQWLAWEQSIGDVVGGVVGIFTNTLAIFGSVIV